MIKRISSLLAVLLILVTSAIPVFADEFTGTLSQEFVDSNSSYINSLKKAGKATPEGTYSNELALPDGTHLFVNKSTYDAVKHKVEQYNSSQANDDIGSIDDAKQQVQQMVQGMNIPADTTTASLMLSGLQPFITTVLGVIVYAVSMGMTVFTVFDLCYIYLPVFREKAAQVAQGGNAVMTKTNKETGETKFRFVTDEAMYAVQTCTVESGKHPASVWIKKRILAYILLGLALFLTLTGNITLIVNIVLNIVAGIVGALQSFGN